MKRRVLGLLLVTALLLGASTIATACGGGEEELSLEDYFQQLESLTRAEMDRAQSENSRFMDALTSAQSEEERADVLRQWEAALEPISSNLLGGIMELDPPTEVEDAHSEFLAAVRAALEFSRTSGDRKPSESMDGLAGVVDDLERACLELQDMADTNAIHIDLQCQG